MSLTSQEISLIIERVSSLADPCIFEAAWAINAEIWPVNSISALLQLSDEGVITFTDVQSHRHLGSIQPCMVCGWQWGKSNEQHESWYTAHTKAYRHLYVPDALEMVES